MGKARAQAPTSGLTFDAGALIALDRGDRRMIALLQLAVKERRALRVPAGVVGQVWRSGARQVMLARFLRVPEVEIQPLDDYVARAAGALCGMAGTSDVIDASVVIAARKFGDTVLTSASEDLRRLDATLVIERV